MNVSEDYTGSWDTELELQQARRAGSLLDSVTTASEGALPGVLPYARSIRPELFDRSGSDHFIYIRQVAVQPSRSVPVEVAGEKLTVPNGIDAVIATRDGWWVYLTIVVTPGEGPWVWKREEHRWDWGDASDMPRFPIARWIDEILIRAHMEGLASGLPTTSITGVSASRSRSDSPSNDHLVEVVRRRELLGESFGEIAAAFGKRAPSTASRWYQRAKDRGL